ncbi:hypothetical protein KR067_006715, partial [Drosophila pandora]
SAKQSFRHASRQLTKALQQEEAYVHRRYIEQLSTSSTKHSLWRAHPTLSSPKETVMPIRNPTDSWARSDADRASTFANHLKNIFQPNPATSAFTLPTLPYEPQLQHEPIEFRANEIANIIKNQLNPKKSPGCDLITPKMIIELPYCAVCTINQLFNAIAKLGHFPTSYSLLSCLSKLFEKCILTRINTYLRIQEGIPSHQFGFREKHGTIEQVNRITAEIRNAFEKREYCTAIFLDVSQAFDRVWLEGLMYKIKTMLPSGVPQGSVLGPTLYVLYTADIP